MTTFKRILHYKKQDWKHVFWLLRASIKSFVLMDYQGFQEAKFFLRLHFTCDSELIEQEAIDE